MLKSFARATKARLTYTSPFTAVESPVTLLLKVNCTPVDNAACHILRHRGMSDLILCFLL